MPLTSALRGRCDRVCSIALLKAAGRQHITDTVVCGVCAPEQERVPVASKSISHSSRKMSVGTLRDSLFPIWQVLREPWKARILTA